MSVIIPTYRHRDFVTKAVESVLAQTFKDYEIIVINDGSPDDTADVLRPLVEAGLIRYTEQSNAGQSAARNLGIEQSRGEFIALLDDDDLFAPDKLEWQVAALTANPEAALVYGRLETIDGEGKPFVAASGQTRPDEWVADAPSGEVYEDFMERNFIISPGQCLIRRSQLRELGPATFDLGVSGGADDWDLYLRLARRFPFVFVERLALYYRLHSLNASNAIWKLWISMLVVQRKLSESETDPRLIQKWKEYHEGLKHHVLSASLDALRENRGTPDGLTRAGAFRILRFLRPDIPRFLGTRLRVGLGAARRRVFRS